jgi:putative FmdB family regulatory protein
MPIYEYECTSCKFYTELIQKISDAPLKNCPSCGKSTMKKLISAPVFRLKGGGWYETDFKSDQESKRNLAGEGSEGAAKTDDAAGATEAKTADGKPADGKPADAKAADRKPDAKSAEKAPPAASRSASKSAGAKPAKPAAKPAAKAPARKPPPRAKTKTKAKAGKRRGR